jgi:hypothetical protein
MHFLSSEENDTWIEDYVERETAGARQRVKAAEAAIQQEKEVTVMAEYLGLIT